MFITQQTQLILDLNEYLSTCILYLLTLSKNTFKII